AVRQPRAPRAAVARCPRRGAQPRPDGAGPVPRLAARTRAVAVRRRIAGPRHPADPLLGVSALRCRARRNRGRGGFRARRDRSRCRGRRQGLLSLALAGLLGFAAVLLLAGLRVPVAVAMGAVGAAGSVWLLGWPSASYLMASLPFEAV